MSPIHARAGIGDLLHFARGPDCHRELATPLQYSQATPHSIQAASTGGVRTRIRRVASYATAVSSVDRAGHEANAKLTCHHLDHSVGPIGRRRSPAPDSIKRCLPLRTFRQKQVAMRSNRARDFISPEGLRFGAPAATRGSCELRYFPAGYC